MSDHEIWLTEVEARLWFLPDVGRTARAVLADQLPAAVAAARWQEALPGAYSDRFVDEALVERILDDLVVPALASVPRVFSGEAADALVERLLVAAVGDLADRFCDVNGPAVEQVALGLGALGRGDGRGEGELSEGLARVIARGAALIEGLSRRPALDAAIADVGRDAARIEDGRRTEPGEPGAAVDEVTRLRERLEAALSDGALTDPSRASEIEGLVAALEAGVHALELATRGGAAVDEAEE